MSLANRVLKASRTYPIPFNSTIITPFAMFGLLSGLKYHWLPTIALGAGLMAFVSFAMMIWIYRGGNGLFSTQSQSGKLEDEI